MALWLRHGRHIDAGILYWKGLAGLGLASNESATAPPENRFSTANALHSGLHPTSSFVVAVLLVQAQGMPVLSYPKHTMALLFPLHRALPNSPRKRAVI